MNIYLDLPGPRAHVLARDALGLFALIVFAWLGLRVYHAVNQLSALGAGVSDAGSSVRSAFASAASAASSLPLGGSTISGALRDAGNSTGGGVVALGQSGQRSAHHLAVLLGLLTWALPSLLLVVLVAPRRIREAARIRAARLASSGPNAAAGQRLLAVRAVLTLPDEALFAHTPDPGGDLLSGRYDGLVAAQREALGLHPQG